MKITTKWSVLFVLAVVLSALMIAPAQAADHPLAGKSLKMSILGIGGWVPSALGVELAPEFAKFAKANYGYDVEFTFAEAPFDALFQKAATSLAAKSQEYNIIISDSQWLGALSEPGWIVKLNDIIAQNPELDLKYWSEVARASYSAYPDGSDNVWGFVQEGDVLILYVRKDLFLDQKNRGDFKAKYGYELPANEDEWIDIDYVKFEQICEFFTRPAEDIYGTAIQYSKIYDFYTGSLYPFIWSKGGEIWDPKTRKIDGILNTDENAKMLSLNANFQKYQPQGCLNFDIGAIVDVFTARKVATAFQWAAMGPAMIPDDLKGNVWCVVPPGVRQPDGSVKRVYSLGGQPWVINAFNDADHMQCSIDFLKWWYTTETQLEFARRGGNPILTDVLNSPGFDDIQPWFKVYKIMMQDGYCSDFWHEPTYSELLSTQQEGFSAFAAGNDLSPAAARKVLDNIAKQQQEILDAR